jgi:hypothetical protein
MNMNNMEMPKYFGLVKLMAQICALIGIIVGVGLIVVIAGGASGLTIAHLMLGALVIIISLVTLGITYCFLSLVQANIETRNAVVSYLFMSSPESYNIFTSALVKKSNEKHTETFDSGPWNK